MQTERLNAAIIVIGNEILSGKTQDLNVQFIAKEVASIGIRLSEVRVVADIEEDIIGALNFLRKKYKYVFTTGGIGPTHDDITAKTVAKAFEDDFIINEEAKNLMENHLKALGKEITKEHILMTYMPKKAVPLMNRETGAPGFKMENVFVMAGVPSIMQAMFNEVKKHLEHGKPIISKALDFPKSENLIADSLRDLQNKYPMLEIGSYPYKGTDHWETQIVFRGDDEKLIDEAKEDLIKIIEQI